MANSKDKKIVKSGNKIIISENVTTELDVSALQGERQGCLNVIAANNARIAEIDILLGAENMYRLDTGDNIQSELDRW